MTVGQTEARGSTHEQDEVGDTTGGNDEGPDDHTIAVWVATGKNHVSNELYQYVQFLNRPSDSAFGSPFQRVVCTNSRIPVQHWSTFWVSGGKKESETALQRKRQTIGTAMKSKFKELCMHTDIHLPTPTELLGSSLLPSLSLPSEEGMVTGTVAATVATGEGTVADRNETAEVEEQDLSLRESQHYLSFCSNFIRCVSPARVFRDSSVVKPMSKFVPSSLEAFAVLTYVNGYDAWLNMFTDIPSCDGVSSLSGSSNGYRFTGDGKGAKKFQGWAPEGLKLYNDMVDILDKQRQDVTLGEDFETKLRAAWQASSGRKRRRGEDDDNRPAVRNNLNLLTAV